MLTAISRLRMEIPSGSLVVLEEEGLMPANILEFEAVDVIKQERFVNDWRMMSGR